MSEPPRPQSRSKRQDRAREQSQPQRQTKSRALKRPQRQPRQAAPETDTAQKSGTEVVNETVVEGADGARHIQIEHLNVQVGNDYPSYEIVTTLPGNELQVEYTQLNWKKSYTGTGRVQTDVCPVAPIGTELKLIARDLTTGEEVVRDYKWHSWGSAFMSWLWKWLKRLFVKNTD